MCGITGAFGPDAQRQIEVVEIMNRAQLVRGPDHQVVVAEQPFVLGSTRLAVQDPTPAAHQPFRDPSGRFTVVFNGEVYNFRELIRRYGLNVQSECDGEVIPLLWAKFGPNCLRLFRGMYGIAIADHHEGRLYLARDPFGIKPLHWRRYQAGVLFASDLIPLWRVDRSLPLHRRALADFLYFGAVAPTRSPYVGIEAVAPGACVSIGKDGLIRPELTVAAIEPGSQVDDAAEGPPRLSDALRSSVRLHLLADVPTALLLSAGVDSALLALAARDEGQSLQCLTLSTPGMNDETDQAKATAVEYGHTHQTVVAESDECTVNAFLSVMPRPTIDGLNTFMISRAVNGIGCKVALSGLGADEALGGYGYTRFARALPLLRLIDHLPGEPAIRLARMARRRSPGTRSGKFERLASSGGPRRLEGVVKLQRELFCVDRVRSLLGSSFGLDKQTMLFEALGPSAVALTETSHYLQPMLLPDADAFSMAWSVELRVPFIDRPFFAAALRRPELRGKPRLVQEMGDPYLKLLSRRRKTGFSVPMEEWIRSGSLRPVVAEATLPAAPIWDHLDPAIGRPVLMEAARSSRWSEAWALAVLDGWLRRR